MRVEERHRQNWMQPRSQRRLFLRLPLAPPLFRPLPSSKNIFPRSLRQWIHIRDIIKGSRVNGLPTIQNTTKHSGNSGRAMYMVTTIVLGERERGKIENGKERKIRWSVRMRARKPRRDK